MSAGRESLPRTLGVAAAVALGCSLLVSTVVYVLRPIELAYSSVDRNRAVLATVGLSAESDRDVVEQFLQFDARAVDLDTGQFTDAVDPRAYDFHAAIDDPQQRVTIPPDRDIAGLSTRPRYMPVYLLIQGGRIERIVLPIYSRGMWSTVHAFVALDSDLDTIVGVSFYEHGETPGIGDRVQSAQWQAGWSGKKLHDREGRLSIRVTSDAGAAAAENRVDGITGATVTVSSIDRAMRYWFSSHGYGPFLDRLKSEG